MGAQHIALHRQLHLFRGDLLQGLDAEIYLRGAAFEHGRFGNGHAQAGGRLARQQRRGEQLGLDLGELGRRNRLRGQAPHFGQQCGLHLGQRLATGRHGRRDEQARPGAQVGVEVRRTRDLLAVHQCLVQSRRLAAAEQGRRDLQGRRVRARDRRRADIRGTLHCHTSYSDGKATIAEMASASRDRGWSYIGITDHSLAAFYAGGLSRERVYEQHREIDALNAATRDFRILKGIEADILADGALDYDAELLGHFDFVVGSVHSRFDMDKPEMTRRVLRALDDPHLTILGHPTGRLLLQRDPYPIDMDAVLEKAGALGVAVELNADPKRLDLDWRLIPRATAFGVMIEIGPDAHSTHGLDNVAIGVGVARKAGVAAGDVLNARSADEVLAFARARHTGHR